MVVLSSQGRDSAAIVAWRFPAVKGRPEPPVNTRLAPAPWKDPIPDVPVAAPAVSSAAPSTAGGSVVASGPVSGGGVPWLVWVGGVLVLGVGVGARVAGKGR